MTVPRINRISRAAAVQASRSSAFCRRAKGRRLSMACLVAGVLTFPAPAAAYWPAGGTGTGQATADTVAAGSQPAGSATGSTVTVQFAQVSFQAAVLGGYTGGGYTVRRYPAAGGAAVSPGGTCGSLVSGTASTLSCQETGTPTGSWQYTVMPVLNSWTGAESAKSVAVGVSSTPPALTSVTPQNPAAGATTGDVQVVWGAVSGAAGYNVYRRAGAGAYDYGTARNGPTPLTGTSFTDPGAGLTGGTSYSYVVRAVASGSESVSSNELSATAVARPSAPPTLTATAASAARITLNWPAVSGATGYQVYRRTLAGAYDYGAPLNGATALTASTYTDTTAVDGTSYRYVVRAEGPGTGSTTLQSFDAPEAAATADGTSPGAVTIGDPGTTLRGTVTLTGNAADAGSGVATLRFETAPAGTSTWTTACTATTSPYTCPLSTTTRTDGLYDLRVVASDVAGNTTASTVVVNRRIDNTAPAVTVVDPGSPLRATVTLTATVSDAGSGVASVRLQRSPTGAGTFTDICTKTATPYSCSLDTTTLTDGGYDLRAIATDVAGNVATSATVTNRLVDNTAPRGTDIQTTNVSGGTLGKPETGDVIAYTSSEVLKPSSILAGWAGGATPVTVRLTIGNPDVVTIANSANSAQLPLGSFTSGKKYATANVTFTSSTMTMSGTTITVRLGTPSGATTTATGSNTLTWTTSSAALDLAGNAMVAGTVLETGVADVDF